MKKNKKTALLVACMLIIFGILILFAFKPIRTIDYMEKVEYVYAEKEIYYFASEQHLTIEYWISDVESIKAEKYILGRVNIKITMSDGTVFICGEDNVIIEWKTED